MSLRSEDLEYESVSDVSEVDPESEVLAPVQKRIEEQLRRHLQELTQQLHEANNESTSVTKEREECGVELYNAQQHLAKLQETLEKQHESHAVTHQDYEEALQHREQLAAATEAAQENLEDMQKQFNRHQDDLSRLSETLLKVENFNRQLQDEVELERRAAHKTESDIVKLEQEKIRQDNYVRSLQERIQILENQSASLMEQITSQRNETKMARDTLAEAVTEIEAINVEKKQLVQQWRSSLLGMQRRHDALKKTEEALQRQKDDLQVLENEIAGYRKDIQVAQTENTKLTEFMSRVENEIVILERQMDVLLERKAKNAEAHSLMHSVIETTDEEIKQVDQQIKVKMAEVADIEKKIAKHAESIVTMENNVLAHLDKQTTYKQESQGTLRDIEKIKAAIRSKELQVTQMENELARIRMDTLQSRAYNETLRSTLAELENELQSRGALIDRMQNDIRRHNDEIDRKQKQLDQLNHQYEQIISAHGGDKSEHVGPLEATINSLSRAIAEKSNENEALQQEWIKLQTELVGCKNTMNEVNEAILDAQTKSTIMSQKRDRLLSNIGLEKQEIAALDSKANAMHLEMKRVNTQLSQNGQNQEVLANEAFLLETDLVSRLEERRREATRLEKKVAETREAKEDTMQQIMNCERDIMFWERKLQVARETELALDPTIGKAEIEKMRKEIGYMEQRMTQLQREQRFLIEEMQKLVDHRDMIRTKGKAVLSTIQKSKVGTTRLTVEKENTRLFKELNLKRQEAQSKEQYIKDCLAKIERTAAEVDRTQREIENANDELESLQAQLAGARKERDSADEEKQLKQNTLQNLRDAEKGVYKLSCDPESAEAETARLEEGRRNVVDIMQDLSNQFPDIATELQDLLSNV